MATRKSGQRRIVAMGGGGLAGGEDLDLLDQYILGLTGKEHPKVCFVPTASGDSSEYLLRFYHTFAARAEPSDLCLFARTIKDLPSFLLHQDVIYVGGGNTANLLAIWRCHGVADILKEAWEQGIILCGASAGGICWFDSGVTDSFSGLAPLFDALGFLGGSFCPHFDSEPDRRPSFHRFVEQGMAPGYAADDGVALSFVGTELAEVVSSKPNGRAYRIERQDTGVVETPIVPRYLGS